MAVLQDLQAEIARLKAENDKLRQAKARALTVKVSEKGAVSVYGLMRFPVTLYAQSWLKLIAFAETIKAFIEENRSQLSWKD